MIDDDLDHPTDGASPPDVPTAPGCQSQTVVCAASLSRHLAFAIRREAEYPSRPELHQRLAAIEDAANLLTRELTDPTISILLRDGYEGIENEISLGVDLRGVALRAAKARLRSPRTPGRGRLSPDAGTGPDALGYCALIVSMAWYLDTGKWPGQRDAAAHIVCEALWLTSGGEAHGRLGAHPGTLTAWRKHLVAARRYRPPHPAGELVERMMTRPPLPPTADDIRHRYR